MATTGTAEGKSTASYPKACKFQAWVLCLELMDQLEQGTPGGPYNANPSPLSFRMKNKWEVTFLYIHSFALVCNQPSS